MTPAPRVFAIVPAAGQSRRMGRPKLLLDVAGRPMLHGLLERLAAAPVAGIVVVTRRAVGACLGLGGAGGLILAHNDDARSEMIDSVRIGVREWLARVPLTRGDGFLVCPADYPGIRTADFSACITAFRAGPERIVRGSCGGRSGHPIVFPATLARYVCGPACAAGLNRLARTWPERVYLASGCSPGILQDVDTATDYARIGAARVPPMPEPMDSVRPGAV